MATCLFTGEVITPKTKIEHTIPRALSGRIQSQVVSCDNFNEQCGNHVDKILVSRYAYLMNILSPLLSSAHQTGQLDIDVPGEPNGLILSQGALTRRNLVIVERDDKTKKPYKAIAGDIQPLFNFSQQVGWKEKEFSLVPPIKGDSYYVRGIPSISAEMEIAALKATLLTFDHLLSKSPNRFTRHEKLLDVRSFIRRAVIDNTIDFDGCHKFSIGLQYERLHRYQQIRKKITFPETQFEHIMFAAGNASHRTLDLVWIIFGFDPFGFRACYDWDGGEFAFIFINGVLANTSISQPISFDLFDSLLCRPTDLRACPGGNQHPLNEIIFANYAKAYNEAVYLVQKKADKSVQRSMVEAASLDPISEQNIYIQVQKKLRLLYGHVSDPKTFSVKLEEILRQHTHYLTSDKREQRVIINGQEGNVNWHLWLEIYRDCLDDLVPIFGLPGHIFLDKSEINQIYNGVERP